MGKKTQKMGTVKTIVILHGWTYSTDKWLVLASKLKDVGYKVHLLEIPGLTKKSKKVWSLESYSEWLDVELSKLPGKVVLIGHSNGGRIAAYYAAQKTKKLSKLILMNSSGIKRKELKHRLKRLVFGTIAKVGKVMFPSETFKKYLYKVAREGDYYKADDNMKQTMKNLLSVDLRDYFEKIDTPTIIVWGEEDKTTPVGDARFISTKVRNSKLHIIRGAGHVPFHTHPNQTFDVLVKYL